MSGIFRSGWWHQCPPEPAPQPGPPAQPDPPQAVPDTVPQHVGDIIIKNGIEYVITKVNSDGTYDVVPKVPAIPVTSRFDTGEQWQGVQPIDTPEQQLQKDYVFDLNGRIIGGWRVDQAVGVHRDLLPPDWYWDMDVTPPEIVDPRGNRWSPNVMTNEELLSPPTYEAPELWTLFGSDDPRFVTSLKAMKRREPEKYNDLLNRYLGNIGENYFAISELLSLQMELEDRVASGTKPWRWPPKLYQQYLRAQTLENQGVSGDVGLMYKNAVVDAMVQQPFWDNPNLDAPPDDELTDSLWSTTPLGFAEINLMMFEMMPFIQEGRANLRSWHELRDTYAIPLVKMWNTKDQAVLVQEGDSYAGALLVFLQYMETGKPDYINWDGVVEDPDQIYWGRYYANLSSSQILRQESTDWMTLEPNVYDLSQAFARRIFDAREFFLQQHQESVPPGFHMNPSLAVQGTGGIFDPQKPLLDWLNENPGSLDMLRAHMNPMPPNNASFLQMDEQEFMDAATEGLKLLTGFPNPRLILDPFFQNDMVIFGDTLTPADRLRYPYDVKNDTGFWVKQTSAEGKYLGSKLFHNYEFIAYLLYYVFREKVYPILQESTEQYMARKADEVRDLMKALIADPYQFEQFYEPGEYPWAGGGDPNDYVPEMLERALAGVAAKIAAEKFAGVTAADISILANQARATAAVRSVFDQAWDAGLVDTEMGAGINAPGFTVDEDLLAEDLADLGEVAIEGLEGLEFIGPGEIAWGETMVLQNQLALGDAHRTGGDTGDISEQVTDEDVQAARAREDAYMAAIDALPIDIVIKPKEKRPTLPDPNPWGQWAAESFMTRVPIDFSKLRLPGTRGYRIVGDVVYMDYQDGQHWEIPLALIQKSFYEDENPVSTSVKNAQIVDVYQDGRIHKYPETPNWVGIDWQPAWWVDNDDEDPVVFPFAGISIDD